MRQSQSNNIDSRETVRLSLEGSIPNFYEEVIVWYARVAGSVAQEDAPIRSGRWIILTLSIGAFSPIERALTQPEPDEPEGMSQAVLPPTEKNQMSRILRGKRYQSDDKRFEGAGGRNIQLNAMPSDIGFKG